MLREEDIWEGHPAGLAGGAEVTIVVELRGFDDDADAKSILSSAAVDFDPCVARLTYRFAPRTEVATGDGSQVQPTSRPLTAKDYDVVVLAGERETNDVRAIRREVALRVLPALRDAESDLHNWRRSPMRDLLEGLPLDPVNLEATASASPPLSTSSPRTTTSPSWKDTSRTGCRPCSGRAWLSSPPSASPPPSATN